MSKNKLLKLSGWQKVVWRVGLVLVVFVCYSLFYTWQTYKNLQSFDLVAARSSIAKAQIFPNSLSSLTFHIMPEIEMWCHSLVTIRAGIELSVTSQTYLEELASSSDYNQQTITQLNQQLSQVSTSLTKLDAYLGSCQIFRSPEKCLSVINLLISSKRKSQLHTLASIVTDITQVVKHLSTGHHRILVLLQNSEEIRASGGFMGSMMIVELQDGQLLSEQFLDVYDIDGQFHGYFEAPPGVKEYLSGGQGYRLPDANWHPDFPTASLTISRFLELSNFPPPRSHSCG